MWLPFFTTYLTDNLYLARAWHLQSSWYEVQWDCLSTMRNRWWKLPAVCTLRLTIRIRIQKREVSVLRVKRGVKMLTFKKSVTGIYCEVSTASTCETVKFVHILIHVSHFIQIFSCSSIFLNTWISILPSKFTTSSLFYYFGSLNTHPSLILPKYRTTTKYLVYNITAKIFVGGEWTAN